MDYIQLKSNYRFQLIYIDKKNQFFYYKLLINFIWGLKSKSLFETKEAKLSKEIAHRSPQ